MLDMILNLTLSRATRRNKILGPLARAIVRASMLSCTPEAYARASLAIASTSSIAYEKIRARTCVINGTEDKMTPRADGADIIYREVPGAELKMLPDVGHWPMLEALEETARALKTFLGGSARL
jgi:pimeloyl-ACP methyl ester carboxylesterase